LYKMFFLMVIFLIFWMIGMFSNSPLDLLKASHAALICSGPHSQHLQRLGACNSTPPKSLNPPLTRSTNPPKSQHLSHSVQSVGWQPVSKLDRIQYEFCASRPLIQNKGYWQFQRSFTFESPQRLCVSL
jgi:hypothetical protein